MRKILLLFPLIVLLFGFTSKCATSSDVANLQSAYQNKFGYSLNANNAAQIIDKWQESGIDYLFLRYSENQYHPNELPYSYTRANVVQTYSDTGTAYVWSSSVQSQDFNSSTNTTLTWSNGGSASSNKNIFIKLKWSDFHTVPIAWDSPYYSPAIETPVYEVTYRSIPYNEIDVPLNFTIDISNESNLYCEVMAEYTLPNYLTYRPSQNYFEASQFTKYEKTIISAQEMTLARSVTASSLYAILTNKYAECLSDLPLSSVSIRFPTDFTAQQILDGRAIYDELRILCPFYGSEIKFYMRYFTIENETQFVVGPWRIWNSVSPKSFSVELPSWYQPYIPASGNQGTSTSTETDPDVVVIPSGGQTPTGQYYDPSINITVGSNVPNYPDYPTIASYNLDNMLVDTMNNVRGLSAFFGEFGSFLTVSFSFFPSWIWAIIGVGFGISIVVMFLKIL